MDYKCSLIDNSILEGLKMYDTLPIGYQQMQCINFILVFIDFLNKGSIKSEFYEGLESNYSLMNDRKNIIKFIKDFNF